MNDSELGTLLRDAAPQVTTPGNLDAHSTRILREARQRRGRGMRWLVGAVACIVASGGGSVAMAGGGNETPCGWVADNVFNIESTDGSACCQAPTIIRAGLGGAPAPDGLVRFPMYAPSAAVRPEMMPVMTVGNIMGKKIHPMEACESGRWLSTETA